MKYECPDCKYEVLKHKNVRYLEPHYRDIFNTVHSKLFSFKCNNPIDGNERCNHEFLVRIDYPLDPTLAPHIAVSYNWGSWNQAKSKKPGSVSMGTTIGEFSDFVHRNTAGVYYSIDKYFPRVKEQKVLLA